MTNGHQFDVRFSERTNWDRTPSELQRDHDPSLDDRPLLDLTVTNPSACGLTMPAADLLGALQNRESIHYSPDARGMLSARDAVVEYYAHRAAAVTSEQIVLTASTSEAYSFLFRLLCNPGESVLIAQPSYPLFSYLADLCDVTVSFYPLFYDHGWCIDIAELERAITPSTRAIVLIHPNNPTGHFTSQSERDYLYEVCRRHNLTLVVDEVFLDYVHAGAENGRSFAADAYQPLTFVLSGLSKIAALPQVKVGWIVALGPEQERREALARLEIIADTFLSVGTPSQLALPAWLQAAPEVQLRVRQRVAANIEVVSSANLESYKTDAGWSLIVRFPRVYSGASAFQTLLHEGVLTHPAHFYGLQQPNCVVLSLISSLEVMEEAIHRMRALVR